MRIDNLETLQKAVAKADALQRELDKLKTPEAQAENEHYKRMCELADRPAGSLIPSINNDPDSAYTMVRDSDSAMVDHADVAERKRLARQIAAGKPGAKEALDAFEKSRATARPMTLVELLGELQKTRREVALATQADDEQRLEVAKRKLRALHRERSRRGGIRVPA